MINLSLKCNHLPTLVSPNPRLPFPCTPPTLYFKNLSFQPSAFFVSSLLFNHLHPLLLQFNEKYRWKANYSVVCFVNNVDTISFCNECRPWIFTMVIVKSRHWYTNIVLGLILIYNWLFALGVPQNHCPIHTLAHVVDCYSDHFSVFRAQWDSAKAKFFDETATLSLRRSCRLLLDPVIEINLMFHTLRSWMVSIHALHRSHPS